MTHDSFDIGAEVIAAFETENNAKVTVLKAGDAGEALTKAILSKDNPPADLLYGVDNTFLGRALNEGIFLPYKSPKLDKVRSEHRLDPSNHVMPVDFGYVTLNYDKAWMEANKLQPPKSLEDLAKPEWRNRLVVQNSATSSPGLAFLLTTIAKFGESGSYTWKEYWRDLRANGVMVTDGWEDAYYTAFSHSGKGDRPIVVSYATSPAAEVFYSEGKYKKPPTGNVVGPKASFLQIEGIGILKGTKKEALAKKFVDFVMERPFQEDFPTRMWVYPVNPEAATPEVFWFAEVPEAPAVLDPKVIAQKREQWIGEWTRIVLQ